MLTEERLIAREGARYWWLFLVSGILWLLIAWMVLRLNATSISRGVASRPVNPYWWLQLVTGILLVLLAFWVSGSDRVYALAQRTYLICSGWASWPSSGASPSSSWRSPSATPDKRPRPSILQAHADQRVVRR